MSGVVPLKDIARDATARLLSRGLGRHLYQLGMVAVPEVTLPNGRRADLVALGRNGDIWIIEIKSSVEDFRTDTKWREYRAFCDRFYFASHIDVPQEIFPDEAGFMLADGFGAHLMRENDRQPMPAPTRKALTIELARLASARLLGFTDPEGRFAEGY